jgi:hypothetical protein
MKCELEFEGCCGVTVVMLKVAPLMGQNGRKRDACLVCWRALVGQEEASQRQNAPALPELRKRRRA